MQTDIGKDQIFVRGGTAGSKNRARLLRRASAGSSPKALLAAAVAVTASVSLIGSPSGELGRDGYSAAALQLSASHDFMGISETILLSQYDAE